MIICFGPDFIFNQILILTLTSVNPHSQVGCEKFNGLFVFVVRNWFFLHYGISIIKRLITLLKISWFSQHEIVVWNVGQGPQFMMPTLWLCLHVNRQIFRNPKMIFGVPEYGEARDALESHDFMILGIWITDPDLSSRGYQR